ncbi:type II toxin-antitoxin system RelB/DinJ family antitoxin [Candidatus Electronema sp. PJ]|uniref:type II toxin-antitoxin system RelB/DinJ family antitoxin n=1 Tax=Candidatus Electronema sp. PJ TaxID=3401572 RepID=UPI003AA83C17
MLKTAAVHTRVDPEIKQNARKVLRRLNMSMAEAISLYLSQIAQQQKIPFEVKIPNKVTAKTLAAAEQGKDVRQAASVDELFQELDN